MQETHHIREHGNIINQQTDMVTLLMRSHVYCCVVRGSSWSAGRGFAWSLCRKSAIEITKPLSLNASFDRVGTRQAILRMWRGKKFAEKPSTFTVTQNNYQILIRGRSLDWSRSVQDDDRGFCCKIACFYNLGFERSSRKCHCKASCMTKDALWSSMAFSRVKKQKTLKEIMIGSLSWICQDLPRKLQESGAQNGDWQVICSLLQDSFFNHETFVALSDVGSRVRSGCAKLKLRNARPIT